MITGEDLDALADLISLHFLLLHVRWSRRTIGSAACRGVVLRSGCRGVLGMAKGERTWH